MTFLFSPDSGILLGVKSGLSFPLCAPIGLDYVFDLPSADWTTGVGHLLELDAAGVAQTHVSAGVDDCVHQVLVADGALVTPRSAARWERWRLGETDW